jgi:hypothetical protein
MISFNVSSSSVLPFFDRLLRPRGKRPTFPAQQKGEFVPLKRMTHR